MYGNTFLSDPSCASTLPVPIASSAKTTSKPWLYAVRAVPSTPKFVEMARAHSGCEIWQQDFLELDLPKERFDGIFANASLFHVPTNDVGRVLGQLRAALVPRGVLFASNPRGDDTEGMNRERYGCYWKWETWDKLVRGAGFEYVRHYYRPEGLPLAEQPWLASVWRKRSPRCSVLPPWLMIRALGSLRSIRRIG